MSDAPPLALPLEGLWLARNSPARRAPSRGTDLLGESHAMDFIAVDPQRRTARHRDCRTLLATEPPERFLGFGLNIPAPAASVVAAVHDGEPDHQARRPQLALLPVAAGRLLGQCGNSGHSTQPQVHTQVMDSLDFAIARGIPMALRRFREWPRGAKENQTLTPSMPAEGSVVEPLDHPAPVSRTANHPGDKQ